MTVVSKTRINVAVAALAGLGLRLFFALKLPMTVSGDSPFYMELARNWLKNGVYGAQINGQLTPMDVRMPGYPAFLAATFAFAGESTRAVMLVQALLDVGTCFLVALIASRLAPQSVRRRVALAGLWLAALCPFTANYTAAILTETLVTFLTALAVLVLLETPAGAADTLHTASSVRSLFLAGVVAGFGTLVRPETPLLLLAAGLVLVARWHRPGDWQKLLRAGLLMAAGLALPLAPWAARNWRTLHQVQFLAPRYDTLPGEFVPRGINAWTHTWLWRFRDVYLFPWKLEDEPISVDDLPAAAFDSPAERARVAALLAEYNETTDVDPAVDEQFGEIARERTARHPLRTYVEIPGLRSLAMWFTPRVELLPYSGHIFPLGDEWRYDRQDLLVTLSLAAINFVYAGLALAGAWIARRSPGCALLIAFILVRTLFFAGFVETPEPRYVLECFPAVIALAAQAFSLSRFQLSSTGSG